MKYALFSLMLAASIEASLWEIALPIKESLTFDHELIVQTDGRQLFSVSKESLFKNYSERLSSDYLIWLQEQPTFIEVERLMKSGITVELNPRSQELSLSLSNDILSERDIDLSTGFDTAPYSESAVWNIQNSFNIIANHENVSGDDQVSGTVEVLGGFNFFGYQGVNGAYTLYSDIEQDESEFYRGNSYLFYERPDLPIRVSLGDITPEISGHLPSVELGGASIETNYSSLQPTRQISATGTQSIELKESGDADIYVNDFRVTSLRLPSGRYELNDLPLSDGRNEIRVEVRYLSGETDTFIYSQFYTAMLLRAGISRYGFSFGYLSESYKGITYTNDALAIGFYEYGVSNSLTIGVNAAYHEKGYLSGTQLSTNHNFGTISLRATHSENKADLTSTTGHALSTDYSTTIWGSDTNGSPNIRLSVETANNFSSTPWEPNSNYTRDSIRGDYRWSITDSLSVNMYASYLETDYYIDSSYREKNGYAAMDWRTGNWRLKIGGEYIDRSDKRSDLKGMLNIDYFLNTKNDHRFTGSYDSSNNNVRLEYTKLASDYIGSTGYRTRASFSDSGSSLNGSVDYTSNKWRGEAYTSYSKVKNGDERYQTQLATTTTITFADGNIAWGRGPIGAQIIVNAHESLKDHEVYINETSKGGVEAIATSSSNALIRVTQPHTQTRVMYSSLDAPQGYDLGPGVVPIKAGAMTTHIVQVGSDANLTIIGRLINAMGEPIALKRGIISGEGIEKSFFTNRGGRFVVEGVAPGAYTIHIAEKNVVIAVPNNNQSLVYLDTATLK